jgi:hypothetical protein
MLTFNFSLSSGSKPAPPSPVDVTFLKEHELEFADTELFMKESDLTSLI